jgi:hypothetical protein
MAEKLSDRVAQIWNENVGEGTLDAIANIFNEWKTVFSEQYQNLNKPLPKEIVEKPFQKCLLKLMEKRFRPVVIEQVVHTCSTRQRETGSTIRS